MKFSLAALKRCAADAEAELIVLGPDDRKLPALRSCNPDRERWLCVLPKANSQLACTAAHRFDKIFIFAK